MMSEQSSTNDNRNSLQIPISSLAKSISFNDEIHSEEMTGIVRSTRSNSHCTTMRPEFVPRPKPKLASIFPTPLKLNKRNNYDNDVDSDSCITGLDSDDEYLYSVEEIKIYADNKLNIVNLRKDINKVKQQSKYHTREYENIQVNPIIVKKPKRKSFFSKKIKFFLEGEKISDEKRKTLGLRSNYSLLNVLEYAYERQFDLVQCKSSNL